MKRYAVHPEPCHENDVVESAAGRLYLASDVDARIAELENAIRQLSGLVYAENREAHEVIKRVL